MEEEAIKGAYSLLNYGVLGLFAFLLLVGLVWAIRFIIVREKEHEKKLTMQNDKQTTLTLEFLGTVKDFQKSQDSHVSILKELKQTIHDKL